MKPLTNMIHINLFIIFQILLYIENEPLQILTLRVIDIDRMVGWLMKLMQDSHLSSCL